MQGEPTKYKLWTHLSEWVLGPQSLKSSNLNFFEFDGGWDFDCDEHAGRSHLHETDPAVSGGRQGWLEQPRESGHGLRLDSTSAQGLFTRLVPGRAKHVSTRLLWTQEAMRYFWFVVDRISTKENPADLNTKPL